MSVGALHAGRGDRRNLLRCLPGDKHCLCRWRAHMLARAREDAAAYCLCRHAYLPFFRHGTAPLQHTLPLPLHYLPTLRAHCTATYLLPLHGRRLTCARFATLHNTLAACYCVLAGLVWRCVLSLRTAPLDGGRWNCLKAWRCRFESSGVALLSLWMVVSR